MNVKYKSAGLFDRYRYERSDNEPLDPSERVLSLRYDKDDDWGAICRSAARFHADNAERLGYVQYARELRAEVDAIEARHQGLPSMSSATRASTSAEVGGETAR